MDATLQINIKPKIIEQIHESCGSSVSARLCSVSNAVKYVYPDITIPEEVWSIILSFESSTNLIDELYLHYQYYKTQLLSSIHLIPFILGLIQCIIIIISIFTQNNTDNTDYHYTFGIILCIVSICHLIGILISFTQVDQTVACDIYL